MAVLLLTTVLAFGVALPMPRVPVTTYYGHPATMGAPVYALCIVLLSVAGSYLLTGAALARWPVHVLGLLVYTAWFVIQLDALTLTPFLLWLGLVLLLATWVAGFLHRRARRETRLGLLLPALHFALTLGLYGISYLGSVVAGDALLFGLSTSVQLAALEAVSIPYVVLSGTDFAEWGEVAGAWVTRMARRAAGTHPLALAGAAGAVAVATLADEVRQHGGGLLGQALPFLAAAGLTAALVALGRTLSHRRPVGVPPAAQALGALGYFASLTAALFAPAGNDNAIVAAETVPALLALVAVALLLGTRPHLRAGVATGALFLGLVAILDATALLHPIGQAVHAPVALGVLGHTGLQAGVALLTLGVIAWSAWRRRVALLTSLVPLLLTLLVAFQVVIWAYGAFDLKNAGFGVVQTALIAAALAWDVVMGGGAVAQGGNGRWLPRQSRVLLYFGYDMLVAVAVLFFSALQDAVTHQSADTGFSPDFWAQNGLLLLGLPMLVCLFLVKLGRLWTPAAAPTPSGSP